MDTINTINIWKPWEDLINWQFDCAIYTMLWFHYYAPAMLIDQA